MKQKSRSVSDKPDPRPEKTQALVTAAFVTLLSRRSYDRIRVSDITRKAGVGRVTFYAYFSSKDALLRAELARIVAPMLVELPEDPCLVDCTTLFAHIQHARAIYRSLTAKAARVVTERIIQDALAERLGTILSARRNAQRGAPEFAPRFVAGTLLTLIAWSLEQAVSPTPTDLQETFRSLVGRALAPAGI